MSCKTSAINSIRDSFDLKELTFQVLFYRATDLILLIKNKIKFKIV